jgi:hypothetical protein
LSALWDPDFDPKTPMLEPIAPFGPRLPPV